MGSDEKEVENIQVAVRCRPMNQREIREQASSCFQSENGIAVLTNLENLSEKYEYAFDHVYGCETPQDQVFSDIGAPILDRAFGGYNGTIFAYGQTGSGKTFSMSGVRGDETLEGLIPRMNTAIFDRIAAETQVNADKSYLVECSFFEIYNEIIYDLLDLHSGATGHGKKSKVGLEIKEHAVLGIYVKDLQERVVQNRDQLTELMTQGTQARTVGSTQMNAESSRSHSIFVIKIHQKDTGDESKNLFAKINLVDLAGSERAASTGAQGDRLKEGANINKSLSALGNVINALVEASRTGKKVFIPYRNSKLTRVLQESLGGNSLCSMLATLSPANINFAETLSTLKYANRAKSIKVNAKKNESSSQISQLNDEIAALKRKLAEQTEASIGLDPKEKEEMIKRYEKQIQEVDRVRLQTWEDKVKLSKLQEAERQRHEKEKAAADRRIKEERTRKWKLLEEKGDTELMLRALRDLDMSSSVSTLAMTSSASGQDWLEKAKKLRQTENNVKDHRTMIMVFKSSLDKDVSTWQERMKREALDPDSKRQNAATLHMTVNQLCSKIDNISAEANELLDQEKVLMQEENELIREMEVKLAALKLQKDLPLPVQNQNAAPVPQASTMKSNESTDEIQIADEKVKGLSITIEMVKTQQSNRVKEVQRERRRMFDFSAISLVFIQYIDQCMDSNTAVPESLEAWQKLKTALTSASATWQSICQSEFDERDASEDDKDIYTPLGEIHALGMESKQILAQQIQVSSNTQDAKHIRLKSNGYWVPISTDASPTIVVDLKCPHILFSISLAGGTIKQNNEVTTASSSLPENESGAATKQAPSDEAEVIVNDDVASKDKLKEVVSKYNVADITGDHDITHELLGYTMSWMRLLKTDAVPTKLYGRPPIRFLHDVICAIIKNTGFGFQSFTPEEFDYAQLSGKEERGNFLVKVIKLVADFYENEKDVTISATPASILAGKNPVDTLKLLCYLALAAMNHVLREKSENNSAAADNNTDAKPATEVSEDQTVTLECYVERFQLMTSMDGEKWEDRGELDACSCTSLVNIDIEHEKASTVAQFVKLILVKWKDAPVVQMELFGQELQRNDQVTSSIERSGNAIIAHLSQILSAGTAILTDAKTTWELSKVADKEKQAEMRQLLEQIASLKAMNATVGNEVKELQDKYKSLVDEYQDESRLLASEKEKSEGLKKKVEKLECVEGELKKTSEQQESKIADQLRDLQSLTLQKSEQEKVIESLKCAKQDLETLCSSLRDQLQAQQDNQTSENNTAIGELMTVKVQLEDYKRKHEDSEQLRKELLAVSEGLQVQLQAARASSVEKEQAMGELAKQMEQDAAHVIEKLKSEKQLLEARLEKQKGTESTLMKENETNQVDLEACKAELVKLKGVIKAIGLDEGGSDESVGISSADAEKFAFESQTRELRYQAEIEKLEAKCRAQDKEYQGSQQRLIECENEMQSLSQRIRLLEEAEEELQLQIQVLTDERDAARLKEEQLFTDNNEKEEEIERIRDGYVWVTDRMNAKEDELTELQEQVEKYEALLRFASPRAQGDNQTSNGLKNLYKLAFGNDAFGQDCATQEQELAKWIEDKKKEQVTPSDKVDGIQKRDAVQTDDKLKTVESEQVQENPAMVRGGDDSDGYDDDFDA